MLFRKALIVVFLLACAGPAAAAGNAEAGKRLVTQSCTSCHAADSAPTAKDAAPPFSSIAKNKGNRAWVRNWLMDPHPPMSGINLSRQEIDNVIAYLDTLPVGVSEISSAERGLALAQNTCAQCHAVEKRRLRSPNERAPRFQSIATTPGMTPMAIHVVLRTPHREMPNLVLSNDEVEDLTAYLMTLK